MATVSASLKMFDQMTRPLQQITQSLNLTISAMDDLNNAGNRNMRITNTLNTARTAAQSATASLQQLANAQNNSASSQEHLNASFDRGISASGGLIGKIKGLVGAYFGIQAAKESINATIGGAMGLQQQLFTLQGIMGNKEIANAYFNNLQEKANESVFGFKEFASNARKYMQFTKNTDQLDKLANLSERLTLMDPAQGLEGAGFALKEMMSGDGVSLKERFGFGKADIEILKTSKSMDQFISKFDTLLNKSGYTNSMLAQYNQSATAQFDNLKSNIETGLAQAGNNALELLAPVFTKLNAAFGDGKFQPFFDGLSNGLVQIVNLGLGVVNAFRWIGNIVGSNWSIISPIIWGIVAALVAYNTTLFICNTITAIKTVLEGIAAASAALHAGNTLLQAAATTTASGAQVGLNAALLACPITWIIMGVILLIVVFYAAIGAVNLVIDCGVIIWNHIATFAEFFANVFNDPIGSIVRLFSGMADTVLGILKGIGSAIDAIFGSNLSNAVSNWQSGLNGAVDKLVGEAKVKVPRMDSKTIHLNRFEYGKAYNSGYKFGKGVDGKFDISKMLNSAKQPKLPKQPKMPNMAAWNKAQGPGRLAMTGDKNKLGKNAKQANKHLKNIDDKMNISNEHLEMMRDLAEEKSIKNFVTLTPTVSVQTGDIKQEADINKIISKIESYMENELVTSAEGVYT